MTKYRIIRYLIAGSLGALTHIGILSILTHIFKVWYLISTTVGFLAALGVSFYLQKFWTFRNNQSHRIKAQSVHYFMVAVFNLFLNNLLMFIMIDLLDVWIIISQVLASGFVAIISFILYSYIFDVTVSLKGE